MNSHVNVVLIGTGIMSATIGTLLKYLDPSLSIEVFERLDSIAAESTDAWNNAGTGHAAYCELNYTPQAEDGSISIQKAVKICEQFEKSKEFWATLVEKGVIKDPSAFIRPIPHISFVWGENNVSFFAKTLRGYAKTPFF